MPFLKENMAFMTVLLIGVSAVTLPILLIMFHIPIGAASIEQFVNLHLDSHFKMRISLTFLYFPSAIVVHYLAMPSRGKRKEIFLIGFILFFGGNVIDLLYRAIQFEIVHLKWAAEYLRASSEAERVAYKEKIITFSELSSAITFSFALLFSLGRIVMGASLWTNSRWLEKCTSIALIVNGLWNIQPYLGLKYSSLLGAYYAFPWLISLMLVSFLAMKQVRLINRESPEKQYYTLVKDAAL